MNPSEIIDFWFTQSMQQYWFSSTPEIDAEIRDKYEEVWKQAKSNDYDEWVKTPDGCLALAIIFDQFPLNMYRGKPESFQTEQKAVEVSLLAIAKNFVNEIEKEKLSFLLMPLMHSEDINHQNLSVKLFKKHGLVENLEFAEHHRKIIEQFGRFPHRNEILGRKSTKLEKEYLNSKNAFKG